METPEAEEARRKCEAYHAAWQQEERANQIAGWLIGAFMVFMLITAAVSAYKEETSPISQQETRLKEHTERMDHMFR